MRHIQAIAACLLLAACASQPKTPTAVAEGMPLQPGEQGQTLVYRAHDLDVRRYRGIYVLPARIYEGADAEWGGTDPAMRQRVAANLTAEFRRVLQAHGRSVLTGPSPGAVTLELTLAGITATQGAAANVLKVTPLGFGVTVLKSAAGMPASFTGSITVAGRLTDSTTGALVAGFVAKESPTALDPRTLGGTENTALLATTKAAESFAGAVDRALQATD